MAGIDVGPNRKTREEERILIENEIPEGKIFLVRHGKYDQITGSLTEEGRQQSVKAAEDLYTYGARPEEFGGQITLMSSSVTRAIETAEIISEEFGGLQIISSEIIKLGGLEVTGVRDLDRLLDKALQRAGAELVGDLVVVTHQPMTDVAAHKTVQSYDEKPTPYGGVVVYEPGSWVNDEFQEYMEHELMAKIEAVR